MTRRTLTAFGRFGGRNRAARAVLAGAVLAGVAGGLAGCREKQPAEPVKTQPADQPGRSAEPAPMPKVPATRPAAVTTRPTTQPATKPAATQPVSSYDSKPPYPVSLYVRSPEDKQPGWLRILELSDDGIPATAQGEFPEKNRFYVDTDNVRQIRIHVGHLPLAANERVILRIDDQGMVLSRKRPYTTLERRPTGEWVVVKKRGQ